MNNKQIVAVSVLAFLLGDLQSTYRANRMLKKLHKQNEILTVKNQNLGWWLLDAQDLSPEERMEQLRERREFMNMIKNEK